MGGGVNDQLSASNHSGSGNNMNGNNNNAVAAFLRGPGGNQAATMQGMMAGMTGVGGNMDSNSLPNMGNMMAAMNNNQAAQNSMMNNFNFDQLKRLQQMAQLQQQASTMPHSGGGQQQDSSTALLQTYLDQKIQTSRFGDYGGGMGGFQGMQGQTPMLGAAGANLLMMNANNLGGGGNFNVGGEAPLPSPHSLFHRDGSRRMRGGVIEPFPEKLHRLLLEVEAASRADVISFVAAGRAFAIHKPEKFFKVRG